MLGSKRSLLELGFMRHNTWLLVELSVVCGTRELHATHTVDALETVLPPSDHQVRSLILEKPEPFRLWVPLGSGREGQRAALTLS